MTDEHGTKSHVIVTTSEYYERVPGKKGLRLVQQSVVTQEHYRSEDSE